MLFFFKLFRGARATGHVFFLNRGRARNKGLAFSGYVGPMTTVAVVPTTPQILDFSIPARTQDKQTIIVTGNVKVALVPATAVSKFDFTVNTKDGSYLSPWDQPLRAIVIEHVLGPVREKAKELGVEAAIQAHKDFEDLIKTRISERGNPLAGKGVNVESCSVAKVDASDKEVEQSIGAKQRQEMLAQADKALHERRLKAAENDRAVLEYEAATKLKLEQDRAKLVEEIGKNEVKTAENDARAVEIRLLPFKAADAGKVLGAALMEMAKNGRIGSLSVVPELFAALKDK
jgi:regulator of protease activity HflC (stomatin/prohibitin superfamily)